MIEPRERDERVMSLAAEALETPRAERHDYLTGACRNDLDLYQEVSQVVAWEERMSGFLSRPLIEFIDLDILEQVLTPPQIISGRFEILRCVGEGGMGIVYEAFDNKRQQKIAIKLAKPGFGRLLSPELTGALKVRHDNICVVNEIHATTTEFGELDFLTMEYLDGETLACRLARGKLADAEALEIARQLCAGVVQAHLSGILHGDLKPANVILCRRESGGIRAVITDFGLSTESNAAKDARGGTPPYMAPELLCGGKVSQASDVFSLGVILYELMTGQKPFIATRQEEETVYYPSKPVKSLPYRWNQAILPCLRLRPEDRCSAQQVDDVLERKPLYRRPALVVATLACFALGVLVLQKTMSIIYTEPPPNRLAVLPVEAPTAMAQDSQRILDDMSERVQQVQVGNATVSVIPLSEALRKGVATPQDAQRILGATHALQLRIQPGADGLAVEGAVIHLPTMAHVRDYSGRFAETDLADLPVGLTGFVASALHLRRTSQPESVAPAATGAYKKGRSYLEQEPLDLAGAMREFTEAATLDPHSPLPLAGLAEAHIRVYQFHQDERGRKDAQMWLAKAEALNADSPRVRMTAGLMHQIQGDYAKALEDYQRVQEIEPGNIDSLLGSGLAYESQGMPEAAITNYRQAISLDPRNYKPYEYLGALEYYRGHYAEAEDWYKKDIESAPDRIDAYGTLAGVYTAQCKYTEAEKIYKASLQREQTALTLNNIGVMLAFQGHQKEAIDYYHRAVAADPGMTIYWLNLGDAQRRTRDFVNASDSYRQGLRLARDRITANVTNASARAYLAYLQARLGFAEQARSEIAAALNSPGKNDQVVLCAVETYEALGDRDKAVVAAAMATAQTLTEMDHHPDLKGLQQDSRFKSLMSQNTSKASSRAEAPLPNRVK